MIEADDPDTLLNLLHEDLLDVEILNSGHLLHHAARYGHWECVKVLCQFGMDVHETDVQNGMTPLHYIAHAQGGEALTVQQLVKYGANPDDLGDRRCCKTPLHIAIEEGNIGAVQALLEYRASPNIVSECNKGISPLLLIIKENNPGMLKIAFLAGADLHKAIIWKVTQTPPIDTLTYQMTKSFNQGHVTMFKLLIQADGDLVLTLCQMPQGRQTKVEAVRTYQALKAILERLNVHHRKLAQDFLIALFSSGFRPRGEALKYIENYDLAAYGLMRRFLTTPQPLKDLTVRVLRKHARYNVFYAARLLRLSGTLRELMTMKHPMQPQLIWF